MLTITSSSLRFFMCLLDPTSAKPYVTCPVRYGRAPMVLQMGPTSAPSASEILSYALACNNSIACLPLHMMTITSGVNFALDKGANRMLENIPGSIAMFFCHDLWTDCMLSWIPMATRNAPVLMFFGNSLGSFIPEYLAPPKHSSSSAVE